MYAILGLVQAAAIGFSAILLVIFAISSMPMAPPLAASASYRARKLPVFRATTQSPSTAT